MTAPSARPIAHSREERAAAATGEYGSRQAGAHSPTISTVEVHPARQNPNKTMDAQAVLVKDYIAGVMGRDVELHKRLSNVYNVLSKTEQTDDPPMYFVPLVNQLVVPALMKHRNPVRLHALTLTPLPSDCAVFARPCAFFAFLAGH